MADYAQTLKHPNKRYPIGTPEPIDPQHGYQLIQNLKKHKRITLPKSGKNVWVLIGFVERNRIPYRLTHVPDERYCIEIEWGHETELSNPLRKAADAVLEAADMLEAVVYPDEEDT